MAIDAEQILEWKQKAEQWDMLQATLGGGGITANGPRRGRSAGKRGPSRKGLTSLGRAMTRRWARARQLAKAGKIPAPTLKALKAYESKHPNERS